MIRSQGLILAILFGWACGITAYAQTKPKAFHLPALAGTSDYGHGYVLVKLKQNYRELFRSQGGRSAAVIPESVGVTNIKSLMPDKLLLQARSLRGPRKSQSSIDVSLYYEIACNPDKNIEDFINDLYQTGYFERVEPDYVNRMDFTPNDPARANQYYLQNIKAYEAWDITQGDPSVTIAIIDSGGDLVHPDLAGNLYTNPADPVDGIDNDNNGYIDDFRGWDFMGADTLSINNPSFLGDNDPQLYTGGALGHGVSVAGCASASTNNSIGISGVGFKTKLMFTKHTADNQKTNSLSIYRGYSGILYAAGRGAQIINCSWGGAFRSEIIQDLINFVTIDLGSLVVAAAGNDGIDAPFYPAAYDNVLSVAAVTQVNAKASFSNFGSFVDISAPGVNIFTTSYNNGYTSINGTSFSSPIVAGAAALVKARFPSYSPQQIAEQLRVTANGPLLYNTNPSLLNTMGKGILDIYAALTVSSPALRASNPKLLNDAGAPAEVGQKGYLTLSFKNLLASTTSALEISISVTSTLIQITKGTINPGSIAGSSTITNKLTPFEIQISANVPENFTLPLKVTYKDGTYTDQETINFLLNPTFIDVDQNLVTTTISGTGRIGYEDTESTTRTKGSGFVFDQNSILYEMGIMMGSVGGPLYNNVRGVGTTFDKDFVSINKKITKKTPGDRSTSEIYGTLSNSTTPASQAFQLKYRSLVWKEAPYDKFVIVEYVIKNPTASPINNFHFGIFADWDLTTNGAGDAANWDNANKLGYVYPAQTAAKPYGGIQLLTGPPEYFAIDNNQSIGGNPFGLYDGFTDAEKFQSMSTGLARLQAGQSTALGNDVSHVVSSGPYSILAGDSIKIAFALHAAANFSALQTSARYADSVYNFTLTAVKPTVPVVSTCYGAPASITAGGATKFKWYKSFTGGASFFTGPSYITSNLFNDTTFYVSNADNYYESVRTAAKILVKANPTVSTSRSTVFCGGESITLSVGNADSYLWSTGATTKSIQVNTAGSYTVTVNNITPSCQSISTPVVVTVNPAPVSQFQILTTTLRTLESIGFSNLSTGSVSWLWDFGDGKTSTDKNPLHDYTTGGSYIVKLAVTSDKGCQVTSSQSIDVITGLDEDLAVIALKSFPNPFHSSFFVSLLAPERQLISIQVVNVLGKPVYQTEGETGHLYEIPGAEFPEGMYILRVHTDTGTFNGKVVKVR